MLTKVVVYAYCVGVFSSRKIQRRLIKDEIIELEREAAAKRGEIRSLLLALLAREDEPAAADERNLAEVIFEHEMSRRPEPSDEAPD